MSTEIKYNPKDFKFETTPQRLKKEILDEYEAYLAKSKKSEQEKLFISMVKQKMDQVKQKLVGTHIPSGVKKQWIIDTKEYDVQLHMRNLCDAVRFDRLSKAQALKTEQKQFEGSSFNTVGGVMMKPGMINEIGKRTTTNDPMKPKAPRKPKAHYIGVELEFNNNVPTEDTRSIAKALADAKLSRYVCVGIDGSCGWEVRVLLEEEGFEKTLEQILNVLKSKGFTTDNRCGTHVHLDMRNRDVKKCYKNFFASQSFLRKFLTKGRKQNNYCYKNEFDNYEDSISNKDRYQGINAHSYKKYKTLEIRMHQGTLEANSLIPWIKLLLKIANYSGELTTKVATLKQATESYKFDAELFTALRSRLIAQKEQRGA